MQSIKLRTEIEQPRGNRELTISHATPVMLVGSCFSDNMGRMLTERLFDTSVNPVGILFNPLSISRAISNIATLTYPTDVAKLVRTADDGVYHSLDFHGSFSSADPSEVLSATEGAIREANAFLKRASVLFLTFGSNHVYVHRADGQPVANCHRLPASHFVEQTLTLDECVEAMRSAITMARTVNPNLKIVLTVSPVRHTAYTLHGNMLSKATLLLAADQIVTEMGGTVFYFPAFEILNDDLRDYRFYADDLKHPAEIAVRYIFDHLCMRYMSAETINFAERCRALTARLSHRPQSASDDLIARLKVDVNRIAALLLKDAPENTRKIIDALIAPYNR
ncbi:MAG: GSCFA domain-containing protein [Muribaculaceae bacterium]|nr:GSCFA domain-containing protein [Muribaculaceae bacterium]